MAQDKRVKCFKLMYHFILHKNLPTKKIELFNINPKRKTNKSYIPANTRVKTHIWKKIQSTIRLYIQKMSNSFPNIVSGEFPSRIKRKMNDFSR